MMFRRSLVAALAAGTLLLSACASEPAEPASEESFSGQRIDADRRYLPAEVSLTDTTGEKATFGAADDAEVTLVFFGYSHCPDICGMVLGNIASAMNRLDDAQRDKVDVLFVTTDPARDDAKTMRTYLDRYDPTFEGLTGEMPDLIEAGKSMKVFFEEGTELPSGGYEVIHNDHVIGLDSEGLGSVVWTRETSSGEMASDIVSMLDA